MKATIEFDDQLYRRLKVEAARRGRTIRDLVDEGVRTVLGIGGVPSQRTDAVAAPEWFGRLNAYAANASGRHDLGAMRKSVAAGRKKPA